ncbi:hypothetical protein HDU86_007732 [Geranomyces michiganensis]|nr:hypothetical protein HDU86_007732 [Geranomyces michiganensis]
MLSHAAALPLPPSPPASIDADVPPEAIQVEPEPRPPPRLRPDQHAHNYEAVLAAAAAVPLPPSPATGTPNPQQPTPSPKSQSLHTLPQPNATQLLALQTRALQSSFLLATSRAARSQQTQDADQQLEALHKRVATDRAALSEAELAADDARRAIKAVGPLTVAEGRLRELLAVVEAFDGANIKFAGAVNASGFKMPMIGVRLDRPGTALPVAAEALTTTETLSTALTDMRAVAEAAAKEMRECAQLADELRAAAAVPDSHAIGHEQQLARVAKPDELAWLA